MAPSEQSAHPKMLLKSPSKPSLAGLSRAKMSKAQLAKGEDFKRNPDSHEAQPARVGGRKGSTEKNGSCGGTTTTGTTAMMGRAKSRVQLNPESIKVGGMDISMMIMMVTLTLILLANYTDTLKMLANSTTSYTFSLVSGSRLGQIDISRCYCLTQLNFRK